MKDGRIDLAHSPLSGELNQPENKALGAGSQGNQVPAGSPSESLGSGSYPAPNNDAALEAEISARVRAREADNQANNAFNPSVRRFNKTPKANKILKHLLAVVIIISIVASAVFGAMYYMSIRKPTQPVPANNKPQSEENSSQDNAATNTDPSKYTPEQIKAVSKSELFLSSLKAQEYDKAFAQLAPELKKEYTDGIEGFASDAKGANLSLIDGWQIASVSTNDSGDRVVVKGTLSFAQSTPDGSFEFGFYKDGSDSVFLFQWQITPGA